MIDGHKVVAWTPYGRQETVSILSKYMIRDHLSGVVDEYMLYMNTDHHQAADRQYAYDLASYTDFISTVERPGNVEVLHPKQFNTKYFYMYALEPDTIYVRLDDDIVYVHPMAIERIVRAKINSPDLVSFPIIWHNAVCSWYLQSCGKIPRDIGVVGSPYCMDPVGWADAHFAEGLHNILLDKIDNDAVEDVFLHHDIQLPLGLQFSVSCFAAHSDIYREMNPPGVLNYHEEEHWHTTQRPVQVHRNNSVIGDALVAHLSFYPHRQHIVENTNILQRYREIADRL